MELGEGATRFGVGERVMGIVGGGGKPITCRLFGRCASWSKQINVILVVILLGVGVVNLGILVMLLLKR